LEVKIKTFPFIAFYFYLIFTIFMKVFISGKKKGDKETKERRRTAASPTPRPVAPLSCPCHGGLKGHVGKRRVKRL
jgi:hypothetical protein